MPRYSDDERRERIVFSQDMFHQIEDNLRDFLDYVPLASNHLEVYSNKLISIILEIGPEIISSFDIAINSITDRLGKLCEGVGEVFSTGSEYHVSRSLN